MRKELFKQYEKGKGTSRHEHKKETKTFAHHDRIYSGNSIKTHLSQIDQFSKWAKEQPERLRTLDDVTPDIAKRYLQERQAEGYRSSSNGATLLALNHVFKGSGYWDKAYSKTDFEIRQRSDEFVVNNRSVKTDYKDLNENQRTIIDFGRSFGLRRSELIPHASNRGAGYAVTNKSLYEKDDKLYVATFGKGGRYRLVECLKNKEEDVRHLYGAHIQRVDSLPTREEFKELKADAEPLFTSIDRSVQVHMLSRQYYANHKLDELESDNRHFELKYQNQTKTGMNTYETNGRVMDRGHAQFVSEQLGHNRISELSKYVNLQ